MQPTQNQKAIYKLLTTSTGSALCDSWGAYGRHWERNQKRTIQDFIRDPEVYIELTEYVYDDRDIQTEHLVRWGFHVTRYHYDPSDDRTPNTEYSYTISIFHWLDKYFDIANTEKDPFVSKFNRLRKGQHDYLEDRQDEYLESIGYQKGDTMNSYNGDSNLSQVYQLTPVYPQGEEFSLFDHPYYLLSIHQGCDVRWGYTTDIMVKLDMDSGYPAEYVSGAVRYHGEENPDDINGYYVSNGYDGYRIRFDEHPTLQDQEIEPEKIATFNLYLS